MTRRRAKEETDKKAQAHQRQHDEERDGLCLCLSVSVGNTVSRGIFGKRQRSRDEFRPVYRRRPPFVRHTVEMRSFQHGTTDGAATGLVCSEVSFSSVRAPCLLACLFVCLLACLLVVGWLVGWLVVSHVESCVSLRSSSVPVSVPVWWCLLCVRQHAKTIECRAARRRPSTSSRLENN